MEVLDYMIGGNALRILNQPFKEALGPILIDNLIGSAFSEFTFISAYAKNSGVARLKDSVETFKQNKGKVIAFIGVDQKNTSYEALTGLYNLCDELYVIHSENFSSTFHHKVYTFKKNNTVWIAVGSNNLTAGGLWTNYESTMIHEYNLSNKDEEIEYLKINELFDRYSDVSYQCSIFIESIEQIDELLNEGYILKEADLAKSMRTAAGTGTRNTRKSLFGTETFSAPPLPPLVSDSIDDIIDDTVSGPDLDTPISKEIEPIVTTEPGSIDSALNESFWFEMRASTGGSRNILDLSMIGKIAGGSATGTGYATDNPNISVGGIKFFGIDPASHNTVKDITINFEGHDYHPSTILFASNNGSWRLQLKGESTTSKTPLSEYGRTRFAYNILVFEKLSSSRYKLKVVDGNQLSNIMSKSKFYSHNGRNTNSKLFGML